MDATKRRDASLRADLALPAAAGAVTTAAIDLRHNATGQYRADAELNIVAPALAVGELANAETVTYDLIHSDNADLSSPVVLAPGYLVQTGADGAGAVAAEKRFHPPADVKRYIGLKATTSGTEDASAQTMRLELLF